MVNSIRGKLVRSPYLGFPVSFLETLHKRYISISACNPKKNRSYNIQLLFDFNKIYSNLIKPILEAAKGASYREIKTDVQAFFIKVKYRISFEVVSGHCSITYLAYTFNVIKAADIVIGNKPQIKTDIPCGNKRAFV